MSFQTVLFDFDGTLADTNDLISDSYLYVLDHYFPGCYSKKDVISFNGPPLYDVFHQLYPEKATEMVAMYREFNLAQHDAYIRLFPGVEQGLIRLKKAGKNIGVVSTKQNRTLYRGLNRLGIEKYFDVVLGGDDYERAKPHPEPVLIGLERLKGEPTSTVMIGDNWQDIASANQAGVTSMFVSWSEKKVTDLSPHEPDIVVKDMKDLVQTIIN